MTEIKLIDVLFKVRRKKRKKKKKVRILASVNNAQEIDLLEFWRFSKATNLFARET